MTEFTLAQSSGARQALAATWRKFARWWLGELRDMCPGLSLGRLAIDQQGQLLLARADTTLMCRLRVGADQYEVEHPAETFDPAKLASWLAELNVARERVSVGFALDRAQFFTRDIAVPKAALRALPEILEQDLARRTPFDPASVWHGIEQRNAVDGSPGDVIDVRHWIVRKDLADQALRSVNLAEQDIDFLAVIGESGLPLTQISLRPSAAIEPAWARRAIQFLFGLAIVVVIAGVGLIQAAQLHVASRLDDELLEARAVRNGGASALAQLVNQKSQPSTVEIWDELSGVLPDSTYLTDLKIADGKIQLTGLSADAPQLVKLIGQSRLFQQVGLVGPITPNASEGKDQFKIAAVVRRGARRPSQDAKPGS